MPENNQIIQTSENDTELKVSVAPTGPVKCRDSLGKYEEKIGRKLKFETTGKFIINKKR